jgi:hypothetical protein
MCRKKIGVVSFAGQFFIDCALPSQRRVCGSVGCLVPFFDVTELTASSIADFEACKLNSAVSSTGASFVTERFGSDEFP